MGAAARRQIKSARAGRRGSPAAPTCDCDPRPTTRTKIK